MSHGTILIRCGWVLAASLLIVPMIVSAQQPGAGADTGAAAAPAVEQVTVHREPLRIIDSERFRVVLKLEPIRVAEISAAVSGTVAAVLIEPGKQAAPQAEAIRLDDAEQKLVLERATAQFKIAEVELDRARGEGDTQLVAIAEAKLQVATSELELAKLALEKLRVRVPFASEVLHMHVAPGQFISAGQPLLTVADVSQLKVELPVERTETSVGQKMAVLASDKQVQANVEQLLPLPPRFDPLRELVNSVASAVAVIDNPRGEFFPGETVHSPLSPSNPLVEIPTVAISNAAAGSRKVQVLRDHVVRDVEIQPLGQAAQDRALVSGLFAEGDELIVSASRELVDGTQIRLSTPQQQAAAAAAAKTRRPKAAAPSTKSRTKASF